MVIAGPNGAGKSTLLNAIRERADFRNVMYVGPHRAMRRQHVQSRHLLAQPISFEKVLSSPQVQGFDGIRIFDGQRDPWGYDDSGNYLKHALCQIEIERQQAITARVDRDGAIAPGALVDPWRPLRDLTKNLLPHLSFEKIDSTNRDQVKVLWKARGTGAFVDLDDLSSGEKSIIQIFYPLVEREVKSLIKAIAAGSVDEPRAELCVLIDEPELHLHPNLQVKVLDYLRVLSSQEHTQIIIATHSPTMVEYASFEELFLLRPALLADSETNQLTRVADNDERLAFLRSVFGSTSNLTAMQPVVVVEGVSEQDAQKVLPDRKLYRALYSDFDRVTVIPGGGKGECRTLVRSLNEVLSTFSSRLTAVALLDRDTDSDSNNAGVSLLPVSMIENFLLDPEALWQSLQSVIEKTEFRTPDDIAKALDSVLDQMRRREIDRRTASLLGNVHFYPPSDGDLSAAVEKFLSEVGLKYSSQSVSAAMQTATATVDALGSTNRRRESFHGKLVLQQFYKEHLHKTGLPKNVFLFETARHARGRHSVSSFFSGFFSKLIGV